MEYVYIYNSIWENGRKFEGGVVSRAFKEKDDAVKAMKLEENQVVDMLANYYDKNEIAKFHGGLSIEIATNDYEDCWAGSIEKLKIE